MAKDPERFVRKSAAAQPISDEAGETWITYNGEICDHPSLRQELDVLNRH